MKFLFEDDSIRDIKQAKDFVENSRDVNYEYDNLQGPQRSDFIQEVIRNMYNAKELSKARLAIVRALEDSDWSNNDFNSYINNLTSQNIDDNNVNLIYTLFKKGNLKFNRDKEWLLSNQVYDRNPEDILYTIKALTFASDKKLQEEGGVNKYFDKPLNIKDLYKDSKLLSADAIVDTINKKQTKGFGTTDDKANLSYEKQKLANDIMNATKNEVRSKLKGFGHYDSEAEDAINKYYNDKLSVDEYLVKVFTALGLNVEN